MYGYYNARSWFGYGEVSEGIISIDRGSGRDWNTQYDNGNMPRGFFVNSLYNSNYHSNEKESRPKTKFFSLMIYAGYPMQ